MQAVNKSFIICNNGTFAINSDSIYSFGLKNYKNNMYFTINNINVIHLSKYIDESNVEEVSRKLIKEITNFIKYQEGENLDINVIFYNIMKQKGLSVIDNI